MALVIGAVLFNRGAIEELFVTDGFISNRLIVAGIVFTQLLVGLAGLILMIRPPRLGKGTVLAVLFIAAASVTATGGYGTALHRDWISHVKERSAFCELTAHGTDAILGRGTLDVLAANLERVRTTPGQEAQTIAAYRELSDYLLRHGGVDDAIQKLESAAELARDQGWSEEQLNVIRIELGVAHLRVGEVTHCIKGGTAESCIFPISERALWAAPAAALKALAYFEEANRVQPDDIRARWLLNITHMVLGSYPDEVPAEVRIPEDIAYSTDQSVPVFRNIAPEIGLDTVNILGGVIMDDFDNDGRLDIVTSSSHPCDPLIYFHNSGDGTFDDWSEASGLASELGGANLVQADYNNDGLLDLLVIRGAWLSGELAEQGQSLLRQNPDGTFTDVTLSAGLGYRAYPSQTAAWADYDSDGDLDLYIGNERRPGQLFRNNDDGTFTDVAREAGVVNDAMAKGVTWGDFDNDGDPDLYVSNWGQPNRLYRNESNGTFIDIASEVGVAFSGETELRTFAVWFWDVNSDGWLDIFVGGYGDSKDITPVVADYLGVPSPREVERLKLALNDGKGRFVDASEEMNLNHMRTVMGANFGDIDNDGFLDIYLGTGGPVFDFLVPNVAYRNIGGERFIDVTAATRLGHLQKGHGIAFGDLDGDGDQDIFAQMGGFYPADAFANAVFENPGNDNHWITIRLAGTSSNRSAIGSRLKLLVNEAGQERMIQASVGSGGSYGASSLQQEIGLGIADRITALEVFWPTSGLTQRFSNVPANRIIQIEEGASDYRVLP